MLYIDVVNELSLKKIFDPVQEIGTLTQKQYLFKRGIIESELGGGVTCLFLKDN